MQEFYQFHRIGHFWVKGQEHWRCLVYIAGTLYAKGKFLGLDACNEHEEDLLLLMEFVPFRHWSPVHESLDDDYPDTQIGIEYMKKTALAAMEKHIFTIEDLEYENFYFSITGMVTEKGKHYLYL